MRILLLAGLLAAGAQAGGYRVAGAVVNAMNHQPLSGVRVTIAPAERPGERLPFVTGADGRFAFPGMPAGRYELTAQRRGFLAAEIPGPLVAGPGMETGALVVTLAPPGVIAGRVTDDSGDPLYQASVHLFRSTLENGRRRLTSVGPKQTADNGEYRFGGLAAGTYYLAVSACPWFAKYNETHGDTVSRSLTHAGYGIQYYRSAGDPAAAEAILLQAGQEAAADFSLAPVPAVSLRVHVESSDDSRKEYTLTAAGPGGNPVQLRQGSEEGVLYNFWAVPPGHYVLEVRGKLYAREPVDVGAVDADVTVRQGAPPTLVGTLEPDGAGSLPAGTSIEISDTETGAVQTAPVGAGGKFALQGIPPEHYQVALRAAADYYLKRSSADGVNAVHLQLVAAKGARLKGKVERDGQPLAGALVVLYRAEAQRATRTASDGSYEFRGVAPGSYAVFAVPDGVELEYANPVAVQAYLGAAQKIKMDGAGSYTQALELPGATTDPPAPASPKP